ncbi:MAG: prenyltransferase [Candidatus Marsarchaeota archaeon]|nr:prenyltransferase [Candidatus Marsarchaeota archaeon]
MIRDYIKETREPTLLLSALSGIVGLSAAMYYGRASIAVGILAIVGAVLAQASVNMLDDYFDFKTGLDMETSKTGFSGGSGLLVSGRVMPVNVLAIALAVLAAASVIGAYALLSAPGVALAVLVLIAVGGAGVLLYAKHLTRIPFLAEPFVAACFALIGIGVFLVASDGAAHFWSAAAACALAGIQIGAVLIANEVPDIGPDRKYGRRSWAVMSGGPAGAWHLYAGFQILGFALLVLGIAAGALPLAHALVLAFAPIALYVAIGIRSYKNAKAHERIMRTSAVMCMAYMAVLSAVYLLSLV